MCKIFKIITCIDVFQLSQACPHNVLQSIVDWILTFTCPTLQYVVTGAWKELDVAIRVTKQDSLDEAGLQFIGDALNVLK